MRSRLVAAMSVSVVLLAAVGPTSASAGTEFGDTCAGDAPAPGSYTLMTLDAPSTVPISAPTSGVITKVKVNSAVPLPITIPQSVKLLRSAGGNKYTVINQTTVQAGPGLVVTDARMPVQTGDRLGLHGLPFTYEGTPTEGFSLYCKTTPIALGAVAGDVGVGSTAEFMAVTEGRVPLAAVIEPDADGDGYGDESQDGCPQSAAVQTPCPVITLDTIGQPKSGAVIVLVTASTEAPVAVMGTVNLGKGKKATLKAGPKQVPPGTLVSFKLKFSTKLKKRLQELEPSKKLTLKITATATNVAGQLSTDTTKAKLKGQA